MSRTTTMRFRIGILTAVTALLSAGISGSAFARHGKHHHHASGILTSSHGVVQQHAALLPAPVRLGAMRYYGGPKSPMWRGPVEN